MVWPHHQRLPGRSDCVRAWLLNPRALPVGPYLALICRARQPNMPHLPPICVLVMKLMMCGMLLGIFNAPRSSALAASGLSVDDVLQHLLLVSELVSHGDVIAQFC